MSSVSVQHFHVPSSAGRHVTCVWNAILVQCGPDLAVVLFIARQHAIHTQRDIVLPTLSVL